MKRTKKTTPKIESADDLCKDLFGEEATAAAKKANEAREAEYRTKWSTPEAIEQLYGAATPDIERWHPWMMTRFHADGSPVVPKWIDAAPSSCDGCGKCCTTPMPGRAYRIPVSLRTDRMALPYTDDAHKFGGFTAMKMCGDSCAQLEPDKRCRIYAFRPKLCREYPRGSQQCRAFCGDRTKHWNEIAQLDHHFWDLVPLEHLPAMLARYPNISFGDTEAKAQFIRRETDALVAVVRASDISYKGFPSIGDALHILNEMPLYAIRVPGMTKAKYQEIQNRVADKARPVEDAKYIEVVPFEYAPVNVDAEVYTEEPT